jgi:signal transduction histidine kinase
MIPTAADAPGETAMGDDERAERSPMAQLLHALNQPLTGLQCSMEVALACPRTPEQYAQGLREGLELTERMRALVEAMREITDIEEEKNEDKKKFKAMELTALLRETVEELRPVAEMNNVSIALDFPAASSSMVKAGGPQMAAVIFRLLDSVLSLAAPGSTLRIESGLEPNATCIRMRWQAEGPRSACSRPELGLLIAQARLQRSGAKWERARMKTKIQMKMTTKMHSEVNHNENENENENATETLTIRLPCL